MTTLHLTVYWCSEIDTYRTLTPLLMQQTRAYAERWGFNIETFPRTVREEPFVLPFTGPILTNDHRGKPNLGNRVANESVRRLCDQAYRAEKRIPLVLGGLGDVDDSWFGRTVLAGRFQDEQGMQVELTSPYPAWCIVDPVKAVAKNRVIMHELCHAAGIFFHSQNRNDLMNMDANSTIDNPQISLEAIKALETSAYFAW